MSKHNTTPRTLSRRLVALLAALALLAAMALPVYAEVQPEPPAQTQETVEQDNNADPGNNDDTDNKSKTKEDTGTGEGTDTGADTDSKDTNGDTSQNPGVNSTTPAGDTKLSTGTTPPPSTDNTATTAADEDTAADEKNKNNTNDTTSKDSSDNSGSQENVQQQDDEEAEETSLAPQAGIETFRIYFVAPSSWGTLNDSDKVCCYGRKNDVDPEKKFDNKEMTGTEEGLVDGVSRKVYCFELTTGANDADTVDCPNRGLYRLHFYVKNNNGKVCQAIENNWTNIDVFRNKCYYADANKWVKYFDPTDHTAFKNQNMAFKNATEDALTNVVAHFYEKTNGKLTQVDTRSFDKVDAAAKLTFEIPAAPCSYVQFTAGENDTAISSLYNFYGQNVEDGEKSFLFDKNDCYCFVYSTKVSNWATGEGRTIYYDATFSKLDAEYPDHAIPKANETVYYRLKDSKTSATQDGAMKKVNDNLYVIDGVDSKYDRIIFSNNDFQNNDNGCGSRTGELAIPSEETPCFYADTSDDVTYNNKVRDGYWAEVNTVRDAEAGKSTSDSKKDVVTIPKVPFVADPATKYISTTLYDYYTDYELNGNSRTDYNVSKGHSQQNWVTFREFDQAISDYYKNYDENEANGNRILYPIYTGHFQPSVGGWPDWFATINEKLNLYGFDPNTDSAAYKAFRAANNSAGDEKDSDQGKSDFAFQGIVANTLSADGDLLMNSSTTSNGIHSATTLVEPHFNESFLSGTNSKNAKLGEVYHNVSFPFTMQENIFSDEPGVDYWWYDSSKTSLYLREDTDKKRLYLGNDKNKDGNNSGETANYVDDKSKNLDSNSDSNGQHGFFPFNESLKQTCVASQYNYGYGAKLKIPFSITSDGKVESSNIDTTSGKKERVPIRFYFSGDDDVWVFIDDQLVLDVGGAHSKVSGILDFSQEKGSTNKVTAYVSKVKYGLYNNAYYGPTDKPQSVTTINGTDYYQENTVEIKGLTTGTHTLTMYYMERGMWESNMAVAFNFPDHNELEVEKEVDVKAVDPLFKSFFQNTEPFGFTIKNLATHYGTQTGGTTAVGFTTPQDQIPDYSSAINNTDNELKPAAGAQFTSNLNKNTRAVDGNGHFQLQGGETITFKDQFRRGSYISVTEDVDDTLSALYDTSWTIYENGEPVKQNKGGTTVSSDQRNLVGVPGYTPDDGRTEKAIKPQGDNSGNSYYNHGENGAKPAPDGTIVFRSYSKPDAEKTAELTRLKLKFTNKVKVGSITIKKASDGTVETGTFTFRVTYTNVGGQSLEKGKHVEEYYTVAVNDEKTISGIPAGTQYTIEEILPADSPTHLLGVTVNEGDSATVNNKKVVGTVQAGNTPSVTATFTNTTRKLIELKLVKEWKAEDSSTTLNGSDLPETIYVQLQRRVKGGNGNWETVNYPDASSKKYVAVGRNSKGWSCTFAGLDEHVQTDLNKTYEYQVVEGTLGANNTFVPAAADDTLLLGGHVYKVTGGTPSKDGTITLTNTRLNPKFDLDILKKSADEQGKLLEGVEFKLEKLDENGKNVDEGFKAQIGVTNADGKPMLKEGEAITAKPAFTGLEAGKYRLTETKAAENYNLLSAPIEVEFTKTGECLLNGSPIAVSTTENPTDFTKNGDGSYTLKLTVLNRKTPTLPHTGADAPSLWLLIGLPLAVAGLLILVFRYNKKGGRQR